MTFLLALHGILIVLLFPPLFNLILGLEEVRDYTLAIVRGLLWLIVSGIFVIRLGKISFTPIAEFFYLALLAIFAIEVFLRVIIKYGLEILPINRRYMEQIRNAINNAAVYGEFAPMFEPHPFVHFTLPRRKLEGGDTELGFRGLKLSDVPKPINTTRIACIGGSTTIVYPQLLEQFLKQACPNTKFQVLNFGIEWWSSIHSTVNFILNVIDFNPDYVILHDNCNDHNYRGYPGLRGDGAHAYQPIHIPLRHDLLWLRLFLFYRVPLIFLSRKLPQFFKPHYRLDQIALRPGKKFVYDPRELYVFDRNFETIYAVSKHRRIKLCLMTLPYSNILKYSEEHDKVYRPHIQRINEILRNKAERYGLINVDADKLMTGEEDLFYDPVHVHLKGDKIKSYMVGCEILKDLGFPAKVYGEWKEIEDWVWKRSELIKDSEVINSSLMVS